MALTTNRFVQGLPNTLSFFFDISKPVFAFRFKLKIHKSGNLKIRKRRAPKNDRDLSGQKCFNFRGVLIGGKTDA